MKLYENCAYGIPTVNEVVKTETISNKKEKSRQTEGEVSTEASLHFPLNFLAAIKAKWTGKVSTALNDLDSDELKITHKYSTGFSKIRDVLQQLLESLQIDLLYICFDELWLIDKKRELSLQPVFLDYLRQVFLNSNKISFKIASIREVTKLNSKTSASNNFGVQSGHDIVELLNLDTQFIEEHDRISHYKQILYARVNYFYNREYPDHKEFSEDYIVNTIFKNDRNLASLIVFTHVIPRNFLIVLHRSLIAINSDLQRYFVHQYLIREVVIKTYLDDKRSNLPMNQGSLFEAINKYIINLATKQSRISLPKAGKSGKIRA